MAAKIDIVSRKESRMKKLIGIALVAALFIGSCNFLGSIINPVIGTWETTILGVTVTSVFNADHTFTDTNSLGSVGVTQNGTWTSDSSTITKTWSDDTTDDYSYSFNSDKSEITLSHIPFGPALTYSRK